MTGQHLSWKGLRIRERGKKRDCLRVALVRTEMFLFNPPSKSEQLSLSKLWCTSQLHLSFPLGSIASSLAPDVIPVKIVTSLTLPVTQPVYYLLRIFRSDVDFTTSKSARTSTDGMHPFCFWLRRLSYCTDEAYYLF